MQPLPQETDVLIIGAGPTGLALGVSLQQAGVRHVIVDKLAQGLNTSRAGVIHAHTLEMLDRLAVTGELVQSGLRLTRFSARDRDRALLQLDFGKLPSKHPYVLMLPQDQTERIFTRRLEALGGAVHREVEAVALRQDAACARVELATPSGERAITARYVVGGDGMRSVVRSAAGTEFEGGTYEESFVLADVHMDWPYGLSEVSLFVSPAGMVVIAPFPSGTYRVVATMQSAPEKPGREDVQALLDSRGPSRSSARVNEVLWSSRFRIHHRVAKSYREGRFFLMGDAAHVHSPAGGQGMNTGLVDAVVLGQLLADVLKGGQPDSLLKSYERQRRPAAVTVVAMAGRFTEMATMRGTLRRALRNAVLSVAGRLPPARMRLMMNLSGLSRKAMAEV